MIIFYSCRKEPKINLSLLRGFIQQGMETCRTTAKHQVELGKSCGREGQELREPVVSGIPQEDLENQLTWAHGGSQRLNHQPENMQGLGLYPLYIGNRYTAWSSYGSFNDWSEDYPWLCCLPLDWNGWASMGVCLVLLELDFSGLGDPQWTFPLPLRKGYGVIGGRICKGGTWGEGRWCWDVK